MKKNTGWIIALAICFSLAGFAPVNVYAAQVVDQTSLLAYWSLDEGTGTISKELTGLMAGRDLTVKGTSQWVDGKNGKAFYFDGNTVLAMDGAKAIKTDNLTVALWAKIDSFPASDTGANVLMVNSDLAALDKGAFDFGFFGKGLRSYVVNNFAGGTGDGISHGIDISADILGKWQHFAVVYNQDEGAEYAKLYWNGNEIKSSKLTSILGLQIKLGYAKTAAYKKCDFNIGGYVDTAGKVIRSIKGAIDDVAVYGRVLTAAEIKLLSTGVRPNQTAASSIASSAIASSIMSSAILSSKISTGGSSTVMTPTGSTISSSVSVSDTSENSNISNSITESTLSQQSDSSDEQDSGSGNGQNSGSGNGQNSDPANGNTNTTWIVIGIIAIVILIAGSAFYMINKRRKL
ncbi:MAG: LamG domain-containing protein [Saccharofermentanales bacterium]